MLISIVIPYLTHIQSKSVNLEWFPRLRCMSLDMEEPKQEQNEMKDLQVQLEETIIEFISQVYLSTQLSELRDKVWMGGQVYDCVYCVLLKLNTCSPICNIYMYNNYYSAN